MKIENGYEKLATVFGVELGQEFNIDGNSNLNVPLYNPYTVTKVGLLDNYANYISPDVLDYVLSGTLTYEPIDKQLLTEEEKDYLETVIKYSKYPITHFGVAESDRGIYVMCRCDTNNGAIYSNNLYVNLAFKNMKIGMMYTLYALGLFDELERDREYIWEELGWED